MLIAADVRKCANTTKALNLLNIKLLNKKDELNDLHKISLKRNYDDKEVMVNELDFLDYFLKAVMHGSNRSEAKILTFSKCGTNIRRQENQKRKELQQKQKIRNANCEGRRNLELITKLIIVT